MVAVYSCSGARFPVSVRVAFLPVASRATVPVGLVHGGVDRQVSLKLAAPVIGAMGSLNSAVTAVLIGTPVAVLTGATAVTAGGSGATSATPTPRTGS